MTVHGLLKIEVTLLLGNIKDDVTPAHLRTSNCYKCMRNFYHGLKK